MNREVTIKENKSGKVITVGEINLKGMNYDPVEKEWFDLAWDNAVDDGLVNANEKHEYTINFS